MTSALDARFEALRAAEAAITPPFPAQQGAASCPGCGGACLPRFRPTPEGTSDDLFSHLDLTEEGRSIALALREMLMTESQATLWALCGRSASAVGDVEPDDTEPLEWEAE